MIHLIFVLIILIALYQSTFCSTIKDGDTVSLVHYEYSFILSEYNLTLINNNNKISIEDSYCPRIAYMTGTEEDDIIYNFYTKYFNRLWIFYSNESKTINDLLLQDFEDKTMYVFAILVPQSLNYKMPDENNNEDIPIFEIDDNYTDLIINEFDIRKANKNIYFMLKINRAINYYPENYLLLVALLILFIGLFFLILWSVLFRLIRAEYILPLHKYIKCLINMNIIIGLGLIVKAYTIRGITPDGEEDSSIFIDASLIILTGIYKTILWFFILLMSHGWNLSIYQINSEDLKFLLKLLLFIYLTLCSDQILDSIFDQVWRFYISELKNVVFYTIMTIILLTKVKKNINCLIRKYNYVLVFSPEYSQGLLFKLNLAKKLRIIICLYLPLFLIALVLHKSTFYAYDRPILELYDYLIVDVIIEIVFLLIFRPQILPPNYNVDMGDNVDVDFGNIYKYKLPTYNDIDHIDKINKKNADICTRNRIPLVVVGPNNISFMNNINYSFISENGLKTIDINKYFVNLNIGYITQ